MIEVRLAEPDDAAGVRMVEAAATATLRETYRPNQAALANKARLAGRLTRLVATIGGKVVGTLQYHVESGVIGIIGLGVAPEFRRRGVARALLSHLEAMGKKEGATRLHLYAVKHTGNVEVFKRLGFRTVAEREDRFSESDKYETLIDVEMEKRLGE